MLGLLLLASLPLERLAGAGACCPLPLLPRLSLEGGAAFGGVLTAGTVLLAALLAVERLLRGVKPVDA